MGKEKYMLNKWGQLVSGFRPACNFAAVFVLVFLVTQFIDISEVFRLILLGAVSVIGVFFLFYLYEQKNSITKKIRFLLDDKKAPAYQLEMNGRIIFANKQAVMYEGDGLLQGKLLWESLLWKREETLQEDVMRAAAGEQVLSNIQLEQQGDIFSFEYTVTPLRNSNEEVESLLVEMVDVSYLKNEIDRIARKEKRQSIILQALPMAFYSYKPEKENIDLWLNDQIKTRTGYPADSFINNISLWRERIHPDDLSWVEEAKLSLPEKKHHCIEYRWKLKDGTYCWCRDRAVYVEADNQNSADVVGVCTDVTEEKKTLEQLFLLNEFISNHSSAIVCYTAEGKCVFANEAVVTLFGYSEQEFEELSPWNLFSDGQLWHDSIKKLRDRSNMVQEFELKRKNGEIFPVTVAAVYVEENGQEYFFCGIQEITHQKEMEKELLKAQKLEAMSTLAAGLAHDYNNILSAIFGYTQLARMNFDNQEKQERALNGIYKATSRAKELVQQILTFSRKSRNEKSLMQLSVLAKEVMKFFRQSIPASIDIDVSIESEAMVMMNPSELHQVYVNLCINAAEAIQAGDIKNGVLTSRLYDVAVEENDSQYEGIVPGNYVCIEIRDNGEGMENEVLERMYDPYFSTQQKAEGRGLGLAVVHGIISDHEGYLKAASVKGEGTVVQAYLPACERDTRDEKEPETDPIKLRGFEHVLFVDDDMAIVNVTSRVMQRNGYKVTACSDGEKALTSFLDDIDDFDIVVTDMTMPRLCGRELASRIHEKRPDLPIILCTGHRENIKDEEFLDDGIQVVVEKPYHIKNLIVEMRKCLEGVNDNG